MQRMIDLKGKAPRLFFEVRWCSARNCLQSFLDNLMHMKKLADLTSPAIAKQLFDEKLSQAAVETRLPRAIHGWLELLSKADNRTKKVIEYRIKKLKVLSVEAMGAYFLDDELRGEL